MREKEPIGKKEVPLGFLLNDSEEDIRKAGVSSGLVIISEARFKAGIN